MPSHTTLIALLTLLHPALIAASSFDCSAALTACQASSSTTSDYCDTSYSACTVCSDNEDACRATTSDSTGIDCTIAAQHCYNAAYGLGTLNSAYGCAQTQSTCVTAPGANLSFCAAQKGACDSCAQQENECRTAEGANQADCSARTAGCYAAAIGYTGS